MRARSSARPTRASPPAAPIVPFPSAESLDRQKGREQFPSFFVKGKPLARRVVQEKASADDEERKTPFAIMRVRSGNCTKKQREVIQE